MSCMEEAEDQRESKEELLFKILEKDILLINPLFYYDTHLNVLFVIEVKLML